jgi:C4-dicarboxylate transporter DctQ subunit
MVSFLKKLDEYWASVERTFIVIALIMMTVVVFLQVVLRYVFDAGIPWAEELARYLMVWAGFLGGSLATRERRHIAIDIIPRLLPKQSAIQQLAVRFTYLVASVFCFFLFYVGYNFVSRSMAIGRISQSMHIPMWIVQAIIPVSAFFMGLRFLAITFGRLEEKKEFDELEKLARDAEKELK